MLSRREEAHQGRMAQHIRPKAPSPASPTRPRDCEGGRQPNAPRDVYLVGSRRLRQRSERWSGVLRTRACSRPMWSPSTRSRDPTTTLVSHRYSYRHSVTSVSRRFVVSWNTTGAKRFAVPVSPSKPRWSKDPRRRRSNGTPNPEHFDLVVTGRRGHGAIGRAVLGSTSSHLAYHLTCPLVIVP